MKYWLLLIFPFISSCEITQDPDPFLPILPRYSETGANTVGVLFDNQALTAYFTHFQKFRKIQPELTDTSFYSDISLFPLNSHLYDEEEGDYAIYFQLDEFPLEEIDDYLALEGKTLLINGTTNRSVCSTGDPDNPWEATIGNITFHHCSYDHDRLTLSATFYLENESLGFKLTHGRFDILFDGR